MALRELEEGIRTLQAQVGDLRRGGKTSNRVRPIATALAGWRLDDSAGYQHSGLAFVELEFVRTGAPVTVPADGDIQNEDIATLGRGWVAVNANFGLTSGLIGPIAVGRVWGDLVQLTAVTPGTTISTGQAFTLLGSYILTQ